MLKYKRLKFAICLFALLLTLSIILVSTIVVTDGAAAFSESETAEISINSENETGVCLPVIMYHSILKNRRGRYIISPKQLENDLKALKNAGYESVLPSEIIKYVNKGGQLPEKPILITFDDGHYNNYHYALPLFKKYGAKGVINIIGACTQFTTDSGDVSNPNYSHLTWEQIEELAKSGYFEIGNHSYKMHEYKPRFGIAQVKGESVEDYSNILKADIIKLQNCFKEKSHIEPNVFAYPFGKFNKTSERILKELGFKMILTSTSGVNLITRGKNDNLTRLKRYNREGNWTSEKLISVIDNGTLKLLS